ncbi:MAG: sigma-70 family RNA polymerase sigma factor [Labilithrix sp.]|nr:sigma-70 family RNA polymerase sigma factor [Labilithrix sp.]
MSAVPDIGAIFREHGPFVYTILRSLGVHPSDVDDAFQEVFVVIHQKLAAYEQRGTLRSWVYGICVRVTFRFRRRAGQAREIVTEEVPETADPMTPAEHLRERQAREILCEILDELDDDKRAVFVLFELEGLPMHEVAESVQCPLQTAYSRLRAAREAVNAAVGRHQARRDFR